MFPNWDSPEIGDIVDLQRATEQCGIHVQSLLSLAISLKKLDMLSCANSVVEASIELEKCRKVVLSVLQDKVEDFKDV
jgi:hypothetical protein